MSPWVLLALALLATILLGGWLGRVWERREQRETEEKWRERERLLDRRAATAPRREVLRRRSRPRRPARTGRRGARLPRGGQRSGWR